jgi:hypothetical protein
MAALEASFLYSINTKLSDRCFSFVGTEVDARYRPCSNDLCLFLNAALSSADEDEVKCNPSHRQVLEKEGNAVSYSNHEHIA